MDKKLEEMIDEYLKERKLSDTEGWPDVTDEEISSLQEIIWELTGLKYESDCDGDSVINTVWIENRKKFSIPYFQGVPHKDDKKILKSLVHNVRISADMLQKHFERMDYKEKYG